MNTIKRYGYAGVPSTGEYIGSDSLDSIRIAVFGTGRSRLLVEFWTMAKRFFKIYHSEMPYQVLASVPRSIVRFYLSPSLVANI